jgi:hypothetical protein
VDSIKRALRMNIRANLSARIRLSALPVGVIQQHNKNFPVHSFQMSASPIKIGGERRI